MTGATAIRPSAGERWLDAAAPIGRVSRTMALVAGASLLAHLAVVGTVGIAGRTAAAPPTEIAVEIVHEVPKPVPKPAPDAAKPAPETAPKAAARDVAKAEPPAKAETARQEPASQEPAKQAPTKRRAESAKLARAEPRAPTPARKVVDTPPAPDSAAEERKLAALQRELESLQAEQAQLQAERAAEQAPTPMPVALRDTGLGLLPSSFQSVALPNTTDAGADAVSYQQIVFSALAKAKGFGRRQGIPGSAGVRFSLDNAGKLVAVELVRWSGVPALDGEALDIVRRATFPPPPQGAQRTFVANVNFEVERPR